MKQTQDLILSKQVFSQILLESAVITIFGGGGHYIQANVVVMCGLLLSFTCQKFYSHSELDLCSCDISNGMASIPKYSLKGMKPCV
jgi:hypothetical protein